MAALAFLLAVAGCSALPFTDDEPDVPRGTIGFVKGFYGGVSADEPRATLAGRDILTAGGSAADAAVGVYFTLAVTMPSAAGLGGGGICLVRDPKTQTVETLDFLGQPGTGGGRKVMVPGNPRGIFALHAKYGNLTWRELIRPAENLARFGVPISRAFAEDLRRGRDVLARSADGRQLYMDKNGKLLDEGAIVKQPDLAATLAVIRARGAGILYSGAQAREIADDAKRLGYGLTYNDLTANRPEWRSTIRVPFVENTSLHFPMPRTPVGTLGAKMAAILASDDRYEDAAGEEQGHLVSEAIQRAAADGARGFKTVSVERSTRRGGGLRTETRSYTQIDDEYAEQLMTGYRPERLVELAGQGTSVDLSRNPGGETSFSIVDISGGAVACSFSMNGSFGSGKTLPATGIFLADQPASSAVRDLSLGTVVVEHNFYNQVFLVGSASGGASSQAVLTQVTMAATAKGSTTLEQDVNARDRIYRDLSKRVTFVERGAPAEFINSLKRRGHRVVEVPNLARVNMAFCDRGLPGGKGATSCSIFTDPRGFGYATTPG